MFTSSDSSRSRVGGLAVFPLPEGALNSRLQNKAEDCKFSAFFASAGALHFILNLGKLILYPGKQWFVKNDVQNEADAGLEEARQVRVHEDSRQQASQARGRGEGGLERKPVRV